MYCQSIVIIIIIIIIIKPIKTIFLSLANKHAPLRHKRKLEALLKSLKDIFNLSLNTCIFPDDWKIARVTPIYKSENKTARLR